MRYDAAERRTEEVKAKHTGPFISFVLTESVDILGEISKKLPSVLERLDKSVRQGCDVISRVEHLLSPATQERKKSEICYVCRGLYK